MSLPFLVSPKGEEPVRLHGRFPASPARLFRAWTDPAELEKWFGPGTASKRVRADVRNGGDWSAEFDGPDGAKDTLKGAYLTVEPDRKLSFSWVHERVKPDGTVETTKESKVTVTFEPDGDGTHLDLVHEGIVREEGRSGVGGGWNACFDALLDHLAA